MLVIEGVSKKFRGGNYGVRDVSFSIVGGVIGTLGPNGAGKTTLMPKTFIVLFLTFWYIVMNDNGAMKALDFAGFYSTPALTVTLLYAAIAIAFIGAAEMVYRMRLYR
jgi:hypothetical protein